MTDSTSLWPLRLLALLIGVVSWFFASYLPRVEDSSSPVRTKTVNATVNYDTPPGFIILNPESTAEVLIRGTREAVRDLNPFQIDVDVELQDVRPGTMVKLLGPENVSLPQGLEVVSIRPDRLMLRVDREETRLLPVRIEFSGEPAAGAQPEQPVTVVPAQVAVRGPQSHLANLTEVVGEVSLEGRALDFDAEVPVRSPDPLVQIVQPGIVSIHVTMRAPELPAEGAGVGR